MPYQYGNEANPRAHYEGTAQEILDELDEISAFVAGLGTGGTLMGTGRRLREELGDAVKIVAAEPMQGEPVQGLRSLDDGFIPPIIDLSLLDRKIFVTNHDAIVWTRRLLDEEGIFAGVSSGAIASIAVRIAGELDEGNVVFIVCDDGWKYLSSGVYTLPGRGDREPGLDRLVVSRRGAARSRAAPRSSPGCGKDDGRGRAAGRPRCCCGRSPPSARWSRRASQASSERALAAARSPERADAPAAALSALSAARRARRTTRRSASGDVGDPLERGRAALEAHVAALPSLSGRDLRELGAILVEGSAADVALLEDVFGVGVRRRVPGDAGVRRPRAARGRRRRGLVAARRPPRAAANDHRATSSSVADRARGGRRARLSRRGAAGRARPRRAGGRPRQGAADRPRGARRPRADARRPASRRDRRSSTAAIALETRLVAAYREALLDLDEPASSRRSATILASHAQHRALLLRAPGATRSDSGAVLRPATLTWTERERRRGNGSCQSASVRWSSSSCW